MRNGEAETENDGRIFGAPFTQNRVDFAPHAFKYSATDTLMRYGPDVGAARTRRDGPLLRDPRNRPLALHYRLLRTLDEEI